MKLKVLKNIPYLNVKLYNKGIKEDDDRIIENVFVKKKKKEYVPDPPGKTFKRILIGRCFGCENINANEDNIAKAKQGKIDQIQELELLPMFIKYTYEGHKEEGDDKKISSAHVAFQKEVLDAKWNMIHITEISFTVDCTKFDESQPPAEPEA